MSVAVVEIKADSGVMDIGEPAYLGTPPAGVHPADSGRKWRQDGSERAGGGRHRCGQVGGDRQRGLCPVLLSQKEPDLRLTSKTGTITWEIAPRSIVH